MAPAHIRREAAVPLRGARVRRLLFWRYLLVFRDSGSRTGRRSGMY
ncbi:hypothetical protein ACH46N_07840 [Streptomyces pristinaespiralis]|nr:hypothetical protein [Streptomyces pristinaespiralis]